MNQHWGRYLMLPMEPTHSDGGWQLVALDLGVDNRAVDGEVQEFLYSQDLRGEALGHSIWKNTGMRERHKSRVGFYQV